jgi:hypothetical protein
MEKQEFEKLLAEHQKGTGKSNWLQDNIVPILTIMIVCFCCTTLLIILMRPVRSSDTNTTIILTGVLNIMMLVLGFYYVSSKNNKDKDKIISEMQNPTSAISEEKK